MFSANLLLVKKILMMQHLVLQGAAATHAVLAEAYAQDAVDAAFEGDRLAEQYPLPERGCLAGESRALVSLHAAAVARLTAEARVHAACSQPHASPDTRPPHRTPPGTAPLSMPCHRWSRPQAARAEEELQQAR